ncbi:cyclic AMP-responsive element-binding protein 3-like protein 2 [Dendronephthya gigantea]|uniref:cyclic AMP-responsive element-binding protein 3-like protein 2 n=1 Tax=Dendronephthya gigantea TaxID=151771 RepID=UPI00106D3BFC|nr:cyclic AMP-responsive element-binding protein 3-like protein 2 [Dendronephthya gigantea]
MAETSKVNHDHTYDILTSLMNISPSSPEEKDLILGITSPSASDTSSDSGLALSPVEFDAFDIDFTEEPLLENIDFDNMSPECLPKSTTQLFDNFGDISDIDFSFLNGLDAENLDQLPELEDVSMPAADDNIPDLESFVDLMDNIKEAEEPAKTPVTAIVKPLQSSLPAVDVVKTSAKITPIIITEIKPALNTMPKPRVKQDQLIISEDERKMLEEEGHFLPTNVALTKDEEKLLKKVRRKIKNKVSAQESRRKKKEYIDGLEFRVKTCTNQNRVLQKKIDTLEEQNKTLVEQLKSLQELVSSSNQNKKQTSTCILVLFLAFALVAFPFQTFTSSPAKTNTLADTYSTMSVRSRTLLEYKEEAEHPPSTLNISDYLRAFSIVFSFTKDKPEVDSYPQQPSISFDENRSINDDSFASREYSFSK